MDASATAEGGRVAPAIALAGIVMNGAAVRLWGIGSGLPHTQARPDETQVMDVAFVFRGRPAKGEPDWILVQESPRPSWTRPVVSDRHASGYERLTSIKALNPAADNVYDRRDEFMVPFAGFAGVQRPGPNVAIYKHPRALYVAGPTPGGAR